MTKRIGMAVLAAVVGFAGGARGDGGGGLAPVLVNQNMTMEALLGQVEGRPIFVQDVLRPLDADLKRMAGLAKDLTEFRAVAREAIGRQLSTAIKDALVLKAAEDAMQEDDDKRIAMYMNKATNDLLSKYGGVRAVADRELRAAEGKTFDQKLTELRHQALMDLFLHRTLWPKISITRADILRAYERDMKAKYTLQSEIDLYTITLPVVRWLKEKDELGKERTIRNPTPEQAAEAVRLAVARARELIAEIQADPSTGKFAKLAEDNSADIRKDDGGRWPKTRLGTLASEEMERAAFAQPPNSIAEPLVIAEKDPSLSRVVIIKVGEVKPGRVIPFSEAQGDIEKALKQDQYYSLQVEFMRKLQEKAAIEAVDHMIEVAVDVAQSRYAVK